MEEGRKLVSIVTKEPIPQGGAATNRILAYSKAIEFAGGDVEIVLYRPSSRPNPESYHGASIINTSRIRLWPPKGKDKFKKLWITISGLMGLWGYAFKKRAAISCIIIFDLNRFVNISLLLLTKIMSIRCVKEKNEVPKVLINNKGLAYLSRIFDRWMYSRFDGLITISEELVAYFYTIRRDGICHIPILVDQSIFHDDSYVGTGNNDFVYAGGGGGWKRDGAISILKSFAEYAKVSDKHNLKFIGIDMRDKDIMSEINRLIDELGIRERVSLLGYIDSSSLKMHFLKCHALLLVPPNNYISLGFPTKLGEYMVSGRPVILSDITSHKNVIPNDCVVYTKAGDYVDLSEKMIWCSQNDESITQIGERGREFALAEFSIESNAKKLFEFCLGS